VAFGLGSVWVLVATRSVVRIAPAARNRPTD
jgi:hypothetical protein